MLNVPLADPFPKAAEAGCAALARKTAAPAEAATHSRRSGTAQGTRAQAFSSLLQNESETAAAPTNAVEDIARAWTALFSLSAGQRAEDLATQELAGDGAAVGLADEDASLDAPTQPDANGNGESTGLSPYGTVHLPVPEPAPVRSFSFTPPRPLEAGEGLGEVESDSEVEPEIASGSGMSACFQPATPVSGATGPVDAQAAGALWSSIAAQQGSEQGEAAQPAVNAAATRPETHRLAQPPRQSIDRQAGVEIGQGPLHLQPLVAEGELQPLSTTPTALSPESGLGPAAPDATAATLTEPPQPIAGRAIVAAATPPAKSADVVATRQEPEASQPERPVVELRPDSSRMTQDETGNPGTSRRVPAARQTDSGSSQGGQSSGERQMAETAIAGIATRPSSNTDFASRESDATAQTPRARESIQAGLHEQPARPSASKDISIRVASASGQHVDLRFAETRGSVTLTMRTADADLAGALRSDLPSLEKKLDAQGWQATLRPAAETAAASRDTARNADSASERSAAARAVTTPLVKTSEAGMQFGQGGENARSSRAWTEEEQELRDLSALRRLAAQGGITR